MKLITDIKIVRNDDSRIGEKSWTIQILRQEVVAESPGFDIPGIGLSLHAIGQPEVEEIVLGPF